MLSFLGLDFLGEDAMVDDEFSAEGKPRSLLIPVKNSDQAVEVFADEIPEDVNDIIDILRAEVAPLDVWLQFAVRFGSHVSEMLVGARAFQEASSPMKGAVWLGKRATAV